MSHLGGLLDGGLPALGHRKQREVSAAGFDVRKQGLGHFCGRTGEGQVAELFVGQ
jgi:hypothetical protein